MRVRTSTITLALSLTGGCHDLGKIAKPVTLDAGPEVSTSLDRPDVEAGPAATPEVAAEVAAETPPAVTSADAAEVGPTCNVGEALVRGVCTPVSPSCQSLAATCGADGNDSCCTHDAVAGGQFSRGFDKSNTNTQDGEAVVGWQGEGAATALLTPYGLDRYEVSVGRFRRFLAAFDGWKANNPEVGAGRHPMIVGSGWKAEWTNKADRYGQSSAAIRDLIKTRCPAAGTTSGSRVLDALDNPSGADDNRPMPCVSWHEAMLFCIWDRARLPTEAEWNYAAAGGEQQNAFPWGMSETSADAKTRANIDRGSDDFSLTTKVGAFGMKGASRYGQQDMAGNVWEWVADTCEDCKTYTQPGATNPYESGLSNPIARGGSFKYPAARARTAFRLGVGSTVMFRYIDLGWRCARNP